MTFFVLAGLATPTVVQPRVVGASLFKNGYAMVVREIDVPHAGEYRIDRVPEGSLGTIWFSASPGLKLEEVVTDSRETLGDTAPKSLDELLRANVGHQVRLGLVKGGAAGDALVGKLVSAEGEVVIVQTSDETAAVPKASVVSVSSAGTTLSTRAPAKSTERGLRLKVSGEKGVVYLAALQRGLTWAPNYAIDLTDPKRLKITAKATILNDLVDLNDSDVRLVAGYPNVPYAGLPDPISSPSVDTFLMLIQGVGASVDNASNPNYAFGGGFGGGGFGGAGGGRAAEVRAPAQLPALSRLEVGDSLLGERVDDLFFYARPGTTLAKGERMYATLFTAEAAYSRVHTWKIDSNNRDYYASNYYNFGDHERWTDYSQDIWDEVRFKNPEKQPISTGLAIATNGPRLMGQSLLAYVAPGEEAEFRLAKALEVSGTYETENVRDFPRVDGQRFGYLFRKATITIRNSKPEAVKMRVEKEIGGELDTSDVPAEKTKIGTTYYYENPIQKLAFNFDVPARQSRTVTFTYRVAHY